MDLHTLIQAQMELMGVEPERLPHEQQRSRHDETDT